MKNILKIFNTRKNKSQGESGFTLVETLVAVAIFASAITALISITARGINDNVFVKNKLIASYLSQEGIELVRNIRDTNAVYAFDPASAWGSFIIEVNSCYTGDPDNEPFPVLCTIDGSSDVLTPVSCVGGVCPSLKYDDVTGSYGYILGEESIFTRSIGIEGISPEEVLVTSYVTWTQGRRTHTTSYQYTLFNWFSI